MKKIEEATDFSEYLKLLELFSRNTQFGGSEMIKIYRKSLFHDFFKFTDRPSVFDDPKLEEVDRLHMELYMQDASMMKHYNSRDVRYKYQ